MEAPKLQVKIEGIQVEVEKEARDYVTYVPELGNISTFGATLEEALENTRDMILTYIVSMNDDGLPLPFAESEVQRLRQALRRPLLAVRD